MTRLITYLLPRGATHTLVYYTKKLLLKLFSPLLLKLFSPLLLNIFTQGGTIGRSAWIDLSANAVSIITVIPIGVKSGTNFNEKTY